MHKYCRADVDILRKACMKFSELMKQVTGEEKKKEDPETLVERTVLSDSIDPFQYLTIASVCMGIYRYMYLEETWTVLLKTEKERSLQEGREPVWCEAKLESKGVLKIKLHDDTWVAAKDVEVAEKQFVKSPLAMIPPGGYAARNTYSKSSIEWLKWLEHGQPGLQIQHALTPGGEKKVKNGERGGYRLDGYCEIQNRKIAYEYLGCVWHGCRTCFPKQDATFENEVDSMPREPYTKHTLSQRYAMYKEKKQFLLTSGFEVVEIWEHEWLKKKKSECDVSAFVSLLDIQSRLEPREAFFGGRTNAVKLYHKVDVRQQIRYVDFTSLYPSTQKFCR